MTHLSWLAIGAGDRRRLRVLFPRRADARRASCSPAPRRRSPICSSASSRSRPTCSAASPASRSASTCAPGRASRAPWSTTRRCSSATSRIAASRAGPTRRAQPWEGRGDCIDCKACVAVCPTGIDIRDGSQLECIQCALCIDACNDIMGKVGRPRGLIAYDTIAKQEAASEGRAGAAAARTRAHPALRRPHLPRRRHHAGRAAQPRDARDQRAARPQSAVRAAVGRRHPQRLHGQDSQQAARAARILARGARPARRAAFHPRHGAGRQDPRHHRRSARGARVRHRAARGAGTAHRRRDTIRAGGPRRGLRSRHRTHHAASRGPQPSRGGTHESHDIDSRVVRRACRDGTSWAPSSPSSAPCSRSMAP